MAKTGKNKPEIQADMLTERRFDELMRNWIDRQSGLSGGGQADSVVMETKPLSVVGLRERAPESAQSENALRPNAKL
jgi:hypothetical protein